MEVGEVRAASGTLNPNVEHSFFFHWYSQAPVWAERFMQQVVRPNTILVLVSDHGMHFGPHNIDPIGETYRANPPFKFPQGAQLRPWVTIRHETDRVSFVRTYLGH